MTHEICELLWLKTLQQDLGMVDDGPKKLYSDNKAAIDIAQNSFQHDKSKHIEIDRHFIEENLIMIDMYVFLEARK